MSKSQTIYYYYIVGNSLKGSLVKKKNKKNLNLLKLPGLVAGPYLTTSLVQLIAFAKNFAFAHMFKLIL